MYIHSCHMQPHAVICVANTTEYSWAHVFTNTRTNLLFYIYKFVSTYSVIPFNSRSFSIFYTQYKPSTCRSPTFAFPVQQHSSKRNLTTCINHSKKIALTIHIHTHTHHLTSQEKRPKMKKPLNESKSMSWRKMEWWNETKLKLTQKLTQMAGWLEQAKASGKDACKAKEDTALCCRVKRVASVRHKALPATAKVAECAKSAAHVHTNKRKNTNKQGSKPTSRNATLGAFSCARQMDSRIELYTQWLGWLIWAVVFAHYASG